MEESQCYNRTNRPNQEERAYSICEEIAVWLQDAMKDWTNSRRNLPAGYRWTSALSDYIYEFLPAKISRIGYRPTSLSLEFFKLNSSIWQEFLYYLNDTSAGALNLLKK
jgi:hypothetical protein